MSTTTTDAQAVDTSVTTPITKDANSGWACVVIPGSAELFGTGKPVKVAATADGHRFEATMLPIGNGTHMLPLRAAVRKAIGRDVGDTITVRLRQRSA